MEVKKFKLKMTDDECQELIKLIKEQKKNSIKRYKRKLNHAKFDKV